MDLYVLNKEFNPVSIIDAYESVIWTDRYDACGDFEIYAPIQMIDRSLVREDFYIRQKESDHVMIIEKFLTQSDVEDGTYITISGRSLESILERRIVWGLSVLSGNFQSELKRLFNENLIAPTDDSRRIPNFIFEDSDDPAITSLEISTQYTGDNLYDIVRNLCAEANLGFRITLNSLNQFVFKLYSGVDRSYDQTENSYVVFSPKFENLLSSNYVHSKTSLKTVALVAGEGEGADRKFASIGYNISGLDRRELFVDARDITSNVEEGEPPITDEEYTEFLKQRGIEKLVDTITTDSFEGEADDSIMFKYGRDFFNGDVVQIANEFGQEARARVVEVVISDDKNGHTVFPTFKTITEEME